MSGEGSLHHADEAGGVLLAAMRRPKRRPPAGRTSVTIVIKKDFATKQLMKPPHKERKDAAAFTLLALWSLVEASSDRARCASTSVEESFARCRFSRPALCLCCNAI